MWLFMLFCVLNFQSHHVSWFERLDYNVLACTRKQILRLQDISKGSSLYFYLSQWQSDKITACHFKGLRFDSQTGHLGCGHYVVMSCTLSCFHSYLRLKLTYTIFVNYLSFICVLGKIMVKILNSVCTFTRPVIINHTSNKIVFSL